MSDKKRNGNQAGAAAPFHIDSGRIRKLGADVLASDIFLRGSKQTHHHHSTVAAHTIRVTETAERIADFFSEKLGVKIKTEDVILGALCHDLGIIGRHEKYKNDFECSQRHARDSVDVAKRLLPNLNENTENIILRHMFPVTPIPPKSREGVIVLLADKLVSIKEALRR